MFEFFVRVPVAAGPKTPITESTLIWLLFKVYQVFVAFKFDDCYPANVTCFGDERRDAFRGTPGI